MRSTKCVEVLMAKWMDCLLRYPMYFTPHVVMNYTTMHPYFVTNSTSVPHSLLTHINTPSFTQVPHLFHTPCCYVKSRHHFLPISSLLIVQPYIITFFVYNEMFLSGPIEQYAPVGCMCHRIHEIGLRLTGDANCPTSLFHYLEQWEYVPFS